MIKLIGLDRFINMCHPDAPTSFGLEERTRRREAAFEEEFVNA